MESKGGSVLASAEAWSGWVEIDRVLKRHGFSGKRLLQTMIGSEGAFAAPSIPQLVRFSELTEALFSLFSNEIGAIVGSVFTLGIGPLALLASISDGAEELQTSIEEAVRILTERSDGLFTFAPLRARLAASLDLARLNRAGIPLRFVSVGGADGLLYHLRGDGSVEAVGETSEGRRVTTPVRHQSTDSQANRLLDGALASASIPLINPAQPVLCGLSHRAAPFDGLAERLRLVSGACLSNPGAKASHSGSADRADRSVGPGERPGRT